MTSRPSSPPPDTALTAEERELALRLARLDSGVGPSAALDARILGAARQAAGPRRAARRPRRWPAMAGVAASLVVAVGLAWQLKPLLNVPLPLPREASGTSETMTIEVLAEPIPRAVPPPPPPPPAAVASPAASPALQRRPASRPMAAAPASPSPAPMPQEYADFVDEGIGVPRGRRAQVPVVSAPTAAQPAAGAAPAAQAEADSSGPSTAQATSGPAAAPRTAAAPAPPAASPFGPVTGDRSLSRRAWLQRIRARRDAGEAALAAESLRYYVATHPRGYIPRDLRALLQQGED